MNVLTTEISDWTADFSFCSINESARKELLHDVFSLRYQVYCLDRGFLPPDAYPSGEEQDEYDPDSAHFCAFSKSGAVVGAVRLVRSNSQRMFPFEHHCPTWSDVALPPSERSAEISRLVVDRHYRRRAGDLPEGISILQALPDTPDPVPGERRVQVPQIVLGLYRTMYHYSIRNGIEYWYAAMEKSLLRALRRFHFHFRQIGPETDYYGPVAPYVASIREIEKEVSARKPSLYAWMKQARNSD